jgi:hypothetical protein
MALENSDDEIPEDDKRLAVTYPPRTRLFSDDINSSPANRSLAALEDATPSKKRTKTQQSSGPKQKTSIAAKVPPSTGIPRPDYPVDIVTFSSLDERQRTALWTRINKAIKDGHPESVCKLSVSPRMISPISPGGSSGIHYEFTVTAERSGEDVIDPVLRFFVGTELQKRPNNTGLKSRTDWLIVPKGQQPFEIRAPRPDEDASRWANPKHWGFERMGGHPGYGGWVPTPGFGMSPEDKSPAAATENHTGQGQSMGEDRSEHIDQPEPVNLKPKKARKSKQNTADKPEQPRRRSARLSDMSSVSSLTTGTMADDEGEATEDGKAKRKSSRRKFFLLTTFYDGTVTDLRPTGSTLQSVYAADADELSTVLSAVPRKLKRKRRSE